MKYFMQTTRFNPKSFEMMGFIKKDDTYILKEDGSLWKEALLYDLGYGKERGLYRIPELDFKELCSLAFVDVDTLDSDGKYNYWFSHYLPDTTGQLKEFDIYFVSENNTLYFVGQINCPDDDNAIKNFKNLCNYMNTNISMTSLLILNKCLFKNIFITVFLYYSSSNTKTSSGNFFFNSSKFF